MAKPNKQPKLSIEDRFVEAFTGEAKFNPEIAAEIAGVDAKDIPKTVARWMQAPSVQEKITKAIYFNDNHKKIVVARVVSELEALAFADITNIVDMSGRVKVRGRIPDTRAIESLKFQDGQVTGIQIKMSSKLKALHLLGLHFGMWKNEDASAVANTLDDFVSKIVNR